MPLHIVILGIIAVNVGVIGVSLWPTWQWNTLAARGASAGILFPVVAIILSGMGAHACDEGGTPPFVLWGGALLCAAMPFICARRRWLVPILVAAVLTTFIFTASHLMHLYHGDEYTGNPAHASGRFWHTPFTGLYPRAAESRNRDQEDATPPR